MSAYLHCLHVEIDSNDFSAYSDSQYDDFTYFSDVKTVYTDFSRYDDSYETRTLRSEFSEDNRKKLQISDYNSISSLKNKRYERYPRLKKIAKEIKEVGMLKRHPSLTWLKTIFDEVNHEIAEFHDDEIDAGLSEALYHLLEVMLRHPRMCTDEKISIICMELELLHHCSNLQLEESFENIGIDLISLLLQVLNRFQEEFSKRKAITVNIFRNIVRIFGYFAIIKSAHNCMIDHTKIVDGLVKVLLLSRDSIIQIDVVWAISNLAFTDSAREKILGHPDLLDVLLSLSGGSSELRNEVSAAFMNFTGSSLNQENLIGSPKFLAALIRLLSTGTLITKSRAAGAFRNLASNTTRKQELITFGDGIIIDTLINAISNFMDDEKICCRATGTLNNLISPKSAGKMAQHRNLIAILTAIVCECKFQYAKTSSSTALRKLVSEINYPSSSHKIILKFLEMTSKMCAKDKIDLLLSDLLLIQASKESNHIPMVKNKGILQSLALLGYSNNVGTRVNVVKTIDQLARNRKNLMELGKCQDLMKSANDIFQHKGAENIDSQVQLFHVIAAVIGQDKKRELYLSNLELIDSMLEFGQSRELTGK